MKSRRYEAGAAAASSPMLFFLTCLCILYSIYWSRLLGNSMPVTESDSSSDPVMSILPAVLCGFILVVESYLTRRPFFSFFLHHRWKAKNTQDACNIYGFLRVHLAPGWAWNELWRERRGRDLAGGRREGRTFGAEGGRVGLTGLWWNGKKKERGGLERSDVLMWKARGVPLDGKRYDVPAICTQKVWVMPHK